MIMLTSSFDFNWPDKIKKFFNFSTPVGEATTQIFSVDCFMDTNLPTDKINDGHFFIRMFYLKLLLFALSPFAILLLSVTVWSIITYVQRNMQLMQQKATSTLVILLFLIHPNIVKYTFHSF